MLAPETPRLTVDIIIRLQDEPGTIVLIERHYPPYGLALPGGFVEVGERVEDAARREAYEETHLSVVLETLLGVYSDPGRDGRLHTASVVYIGRARGVPRAGDDAKNCLVAQVEAITEPLAFDHAEILADYLTFLRLGQVPAPH